MKRNTLPVNFNGILLPAAGIDLYKWAVVACDQFTGDPAYWDAVERLVGDAPGAYRLTFPEIYLESDNSARIKAIHAAMNAYLRGGMFTEYRDCAVLTERRTPYHARRLGLLFSVDLEAYSWKPEDCAPIRATEGTILERIPPRVEIRRGAPLEISHTMLLIDDPKRALIETLYEKTKARPPVYDTDLNMNGGHITGWIVGDTAAISESLAALVKEDGFLFAVGDGNHSLAAAKAYWEEIKGALSAQERGDHPARFALCEAVNIYDEGLAFEPIHRVVYDTDAEKFKAGLSRLKSGADAVETIRGTQSFIDEYIREHGGAADYIHGERELADAVKRAAARNPVPVPMPKIEKADFFRLLGKYGILPRKAFSMGEGVEKRYYLEARKIRRG
ncbi:MAG: DUF1015 domain-containing protein [Clostridiales bacterium]|nr:DUF1015 domain-containing protein [Clostridiales bacterium]